MASSRTLASSISPPPSLQSGLTPQSPISPFVSRNLSFSRNGSLNLPLKTQNFPSNVFKDSSQAQVSVAETVVSPQLFDVPLLSSSEVIERFRRSRETYKSKQKYLAMYSSLFGGITTDPAAMVIPMDDHMVHRGHGVFDTAAIVDGYLYELDQHLDRIIGSAAMAKINIPFNREIIKTILIQTVGVSNCRNGSLRYWLSAGPGDFQLSPSGCHESSLHAIVIQDESPSNYKGIKAVTSSIPIKPPQFAVMKSVNYLPNVLSKMEAEENDAYAAIWLDDEGYIAEGPNMNVAFITKEKELVMPRFDKILSGCTAKRVLVLAEGLVEEGKIRGILVGDMTVEEGKQADEMMLIGSGVLVRAVTQWDDQVVGDGNEGPIARTLLNLILQDMKSGPATMLPGSKPRSHFMQKAVALLEKQEIHSYSCKEKKYIN